MAGGMAAGTVLALAPDRACIVCRTARRLRDWPSAEGVRASFVAPDGAPLVCAACLDVERRDPSGSARTQVMQALDALARPAEAFVRWPFRAWDALAGPMAPGTVHYVAAASGNGKTTLITSAIGAWLAAGVRVAVAPLELRPWDWRIQMACVRANVAPGDVLSGELLIREQAGDLLARHLLDAVRDQLRAMHRKVDEHHALHVVPDRALSARTLRQVFGHAKDYGYQVVVIDHIDHVSDDEGRSGLEESKAVNAAVAEEAQACDVIAVATSQLNAHRLQGRDKLAKYAPPGTRDLYLHTYKEHVATSILGLFRPILPDATAEALAAARSGEAEPHTVWEPHAMGVVAAKLRNYGAREGQRAYLTVERGAARDRTDPEARDWEAARNGLRAR